MSAGRTSICRHALLAFTLLGGSASLAAAARIEMEIGTQPGFPPTAMQQWYQLLTELKVDQLRIRSLTAADTLGVETAGGPGNPTYRVTAVLTQRSELVLPEGRFTLRDRQRLSAWLEQLRAGRVPGQPVEPPQPFGLPPEQLQALRDDLRTTISTDTRGQRLAAVLNSTKGLLRHPVLAEPAAVEAITAAAPVNEELRGLSAGTALAAALRPSALVLVPQRDAAGQAQLVVAPARTDQQSWPVGWPLPRPGRDLVPPMYELINANIDDVPLSQVLEIVAGRMQLPVIVDQQALAREGIEMSQVRVNLPPKQLTYYDVLAKTLFQAGCKHELRVDDADKPFLWITTLK